MRLELHCLRCQHDFLVPNDSPAADALEQTAAEGPWCAVGDGQTLEDKVYSDLLASDAGRCPECGGPVTLREECLGQFAQELLACW
jgi:hypothetical protein